MCIIFWARSASLRSQGGLALLTALRAYPPIRGAPPLPVTRDARALRAHRGARLASLLREDGFELRPEGRVGDACDDPHDRHRARVDDEVLGEGLLREEGVE